MIRRYFLVPVLTLLICCALGMTACSTNDGVDAQGDLLAEAAREATAIVQQAQATALVLQAQAQATAVMNEVNTSNSKATPEATWMAFIPPTEYAEVIQEASTQGDQSPDSVNTVEVVSVSLGLEGSLIMVRFYAPAEVAATWWQGSASVEDESNGTTYDEIPVMPKIGPLIGRPKRDGQIGYVMLMNTPPGLESGVLVTVTLGEYRFEHIPVQ
jgi:hypothetical protein